jgi:thiol-disulfide isomerase/thioredoxin
MSQFYTWLSTLRKGAILTLMLLIFTSAAQAGVGPIDNFAATLDGFSAEAKPFPEKIVLFDFKDQSSSLTFGPGQPWRLINFWAVWCAPCIAELPSLKKLQDRVRDVPGLKVLLVSSDMPANGAALKYLIKQKNLPDIDAYYVKDFFIWQSFDMKGLPTTILVNPEGQIIYTFTGDADWDSAEALAFFKAVLPPSTLP